VNAAVLLRKTFIFFGIAFALMNACNIAYKADLAAFYRVKYWTPYAAKSPEPSEISRMACSNGFYNQHHALLVDMGLPSNAPRMRVLDMTKNEIVFKTRVMHGKGSGERWAVHFSNRMGSNMTSLGRYVIVGHYSGKFGTAYRLAGLDATNSNALSRSIVLHQSQYAKLNRIGRSEGCPAVSKKAMIEMTPYLTTGTFLWIYK
jgi:hypothetical protein